MLPNARRHRQIKQTSHASRLIQRENDQDKINTPAKQLWASQLHEAPSESPLSNHRVHSPTGRVMSMRSSHNLKTARPTRILTALN